MGLLIVLATLPATRVLAAGPGAAPSPPHPVGSPGAWMSDDDYPATALGKNTTGVVGFELTVAPNGIPSNCEIIKSSKDADLDEATCRLLLKRAQFTPAIGADGKPATGSYRSSVRWQIPVLPMPASGRLTMAFDILPDGNSANCVANASGSALVALPGGDPKAACNQTWHYDPPVDSAGKPVKRHVMIDHVMTVTETP